MLDIFCLSNWHLESIYNRRHMINEFVFLQGHSLFAPLAICIPYICIGEWSDRDRLDWIFSISAHVLLETAQQVPSTHHVDVGSSVLARMPNCLFDVYKKQHNSELLGVIKKHGAESLQGLWNLIPASQIEVSSLEPGLGQRWTNTSRQAYGTSTLWMLLDSCCQPKHIKAWSWLFIAPKIKNKLIRESK